MNPYSFIPFSSFLFNILLAVAVFALNPRSKTNRAFCLFACNFALWAFLSFLEWNFTAPGLLRIFAHIEPACWLPTTLLVLNFIYVLVKRPRDWVFWSFSVIVITWSVIASITCCLLTGFRHTYWGEFTVVTNLYLPAVTMSSFLPAFWGFYILFKTFLNASDRNFRIHLLYMTIGTLAMYIVVISESVFRTSLMQIDSFPFLGSFFPIIQSAVIFFAIVRHRFLNVDVRDAAHEIFSQIHEAVLLLDLNKGISDMNESAQKFFGVKKEEKNKGLEHFFGTGYRFDENYGNREIIYANHGEVKSGLYSQSDLFDRGRLIGKLVVIRDMTYRREEERKRAQLEYTIQQSHQSRLESLGMLAGGIAHDFNNMLSGMIGYATILRFELAGKEKKLMSYAENIIKVARQASDLTKKLLTFARRNVSEVTIFNLHETITETISLLEHTLGKNIIIKTDLAAQSSTLAGDQAQIQNMLLNMAINSRDAMPNGGEIRFKTRNMDMTDTEVKAFNKEAEGGVFIVVDLEDTGTGMAEEVKKKIFDPFFTTKRPGKGTGLGLASAYGISKSHKGFITLDTQVGKGTAFHSFFPVSNAEPLTEPENLTAVEWGHGSILLVDDENDVRDATASMLRAIGYTVKDFGSGEEAVQWHQEHKDGVDLALLDVMMPGMTGDQCAEVLKKINPNVKILFISGFSDTLSSDKLTVLSKTLGPVQLMHKPFTVEQLSQTVKIAMDA